jgi:AraC-like DNA-binding protein
MTTASIPLTRESLLAPFIHAARQIGCPVDKLLHASKLPQLTGDPDTIIPEIPGWQFVQAVARTENLDNFGLLTASLTRHTDLEGVDTLLSGCLILHDLLKRVCQIGPMFSTVNHYVLEEDGDVVWFGQRGARLLNEYTQMELFEVLGLIQLVQVAAGPTWRPPQIRFSFKYYKPALHAEELNPSQIVFSQAYPAIAVPRYLLSLDLTGLKTSSVNGSADTYKALSTPGSFVDSLRSAILPYLGDQTPDINLAADISGMHVRTLQRRLAKQDMTYSAIVEQARLLKAKSLLNEKSLKLLDITLMLGYSEPATFTRAFRRWAGVSPSEYRKYLLTHTTGAHY